MLGCDRNMTYSTQLQKNVRKDGRSGTALGTVTESAQRLSMREWDEGDEDNGRTKATDLKSKARRKIHMPST